MTLKHLLIANRGEIAIRIARSTAESGIRAHAVYSEDDEQSDHLKKADEAHRLTGTGPAAYLDAEQILRVALEARCDAVHPGYGFLSENAGFARRCIEAGLCFVGPTPDVLEVLGDKGKARSLALACDVPVLPGTNGATSMDEARRFLQSLGANGAVMIKAIGGGGGRGIRQVDNVLELDSAYERCRSEAMQAFGNRDVYVEKLVPKARHIEVQVIGDGTGEVTHLWERECSLQRNRQKLVEIAPAPGLPAALRERLIDAALRMARAVKLRSLATLPGDLMKAAAKARRALSEFRISGVSTNREFLLNLLSSSDFVSGQWYTGFIEDNLVSLCAPSRHPRLYGEHSNASAPATQVDPIDPLAILTHGKRDIGAVAAPEDAPLPEGMRAICAAISGTVVSIDVRVGDSVYRGQQVAVMEAMKMEHVLVSAATGVVREIRVAPDQTLLEGAALLTVDVVEDQPDAVASAQSIDPDHVRPDLAELQERRALTLDPARPDAVEKRHKLGLRTARENITDLCDPGSFHEYGAFAVAAQRSRRTMDDLIARTPADGLVMGIGRVNGALFPDIDARCVAMSYDYTVLAGTQGSKNHEKKDRMFELAAEWRLPVVVFAEGGGGRPGDTDAIVSGWLHIKAFTLLAKLSGLVPLVGVVSGRCFAGNAVVAGCCDVIIATEKTSLGMGGPAMIEGGGLGVFHPDEVGPTSVQRRNGVIDVVVADEAEAVRVAKQYLSYFQGPIEEWKCADQRELRQLIPENRLRVYDVHRVIDLIADHGSVLELRRDFATNMITALVRMEGRPLGLLANNPMVLGGAVDANAADKAARFLQLCDAFDIPVLSLCDTPGNMVGPEAERTALVRHCCRLYVVGANLTVPIFSVVLRKAYGLGSQGMVGGSFHLPMFCVAWPTGELGPMNLEGSVKLGFRKELEAITDPALRKARFDEMVAEAYERGKALSAATLFEIDDVIDPADTRSWVMAGLRSLPAPKPRTGKKRACVDTW
jgi:acetyl-CoA carboxylase carboxyltransferase component/biotin carboxylase